MRGSADDAASDMEAPVPRARPVAVVTGASSGIGRTTALTLARHGYTIVGVARREARLVEVVERCREHAPDSCHLAGDLGGRAFAESVVDETWKRHGRLDVLVNNAAVPFHKQIYRTRAEEAERVMRINFFSCLWTSLAAIPYMLRQGGGTIVNVSSFASQVVPTHESIYAASKGAMNAFSQGLWADLDGSGIHVALVHPGPIETEIWQKLEEPGAYSGKRYPAQLVADAIYDAILHERHEVVVPRHNPSLTLARWLRLLLPGLVRFGVRRSDPMTPDALRRARERAHAGKRLGED